MGPISNRYIQVVLDARRRNAAHAASSRSWRPRQASPASTSAWSRTPGCCTSTRSAPRGRRSRRAVVRG